LRASGLADGECSGVIGSFFHSFTLASLTDYGSKGVGHYGLDKTIELHVMMFYKQGKWEIPPEMEAALLLPDAGASGPALPTSLKLEPFPTILKTVPHFPPYLLHAPGESSCS
jgi:hypothetical protein